MSWDFAMHGQVTFPDEETLWGWLTLPIEQPSGVSGPLCAEVDPRRSVHEALTAFRPDELHVERKGRRVKLRGWIEKTAMIDLGPPLVGALFTAATLGAEGRLWLIAMGNTLAYRIGIADGAAVICEIDEDMEGSEQAEEAMAAMRQPVANTWLVAPVPESPEDYWFTVAREQSGKLLPEVLAALRFGGKRRLTRGDVEKMLADGALIVDGHVGRSHDKVVEGQRVCIKGWRPLLAPAPAK